MQRTKSSTKKSRKKAKHTAEAGSAYVEADSCDEKECVEESQPGEILIKVNPYSLVDFFPTDDVKILSRIQFTEEALYSSTTLSHANYIRDIIKLYYPEDEHSELVITDATSCVGGTLMSCIEPFGIINAVELNPVHAKLLKNNLCTIFPVKCNDINFVNANYLDVWDTFKPKSNVIIFDPPWGGCDYYKEVNLKLYLKDSSGKSIEIVDIINMMKTQTDLVMVRIPYNYDMDRLKRIEFKYTHTYQFLKKYPNDGSYRSGKIKTLYYMYVFSHKKAVGNIDGLDPHSYYATVNYRDISFTTLDL